MQSCNKLVIFEVLVELQYLHSCHMICFAQELQAEMKKHMAHLQQLKDYNETLALEREENARQEQERRRMEVN